MKAILIPTDFSKNAENAMYYGLEFALIKSCGVILLNSFPFIYHGSSRIDAAMEELKQYSQDMIKSTIKGLKENTKFKDLSIKGINMFGNLDMAISQTAEQHEVELIIMGTKGASKVNKMLLGSNTVQVIRNSNLPVLVVPENAEYRNFEKIIYAVDYKKDNLKMMKEMLGVISLFQVKVASVYVAKTGSLEEEIQHRAFKKLMEEVFPDVFEEHHFICNPSTFEGIESVLHTDPNSLLAINHHHHKSFIDNLLSKSLGKEMAYQKRTPFLILNN